MSMQGGCLCGSVTFVVSAASKWVAHCHCNLCQRAHGAGVVTWVGTQEDSVTISDPGQRLTWYASSERGERAFCNQCGTSLFFRGIKWPGELHIARALFTGDVDRNPDGHAHEESRVDWLSVN